MAEISAKARLRAMFMSKTQIIYLCNNFLQCVIYGAFAGVWGYQQNGLGTRYYSLNVLLGCFISCLYCWFSTDMKKKEWIFEHYKAIDVTESIFYTCTEMGFLFLYFKLGYPVLISDEITAASVLWLFFGWSMFYKFVNAIISTILPSIGDVFEQSLYKNQIDYQNHSNAEGLMNCTGAVVGAIASFGIGDFFKVHPWIMFLLVFFDWISLWARWQFYFNAENYEIIKVNFAADVQAWLDKMSKPQPKIK